MGRASEEARHHFLGKWDESVVKPLFTQYSKTHKITIHQGNNSR